MAVYTQLTNETIAELLEQHYDIGTLDFAVGIAQGVENTNYLIVTDRAGVEEKYILTLYEKRVNPADLPFFIGLMEHVAQHGVAVPKPIARRDGTLTGEVAGKQSALISFLHGKSRTIMRNPHAAGVGSALGALHKAADDFSGVRANSLSLEGWKMLQQKIANRFDEIQPGLTKFIADEMEFLSAQWDKIAALPQGVIHADLFPDNVFFIDDEVSGVIDFYFACNDAWAYDVAITINAWCFEQSGEFNVTKSKLLLTNYQKNRGLSAAEIAALPLLLRGAAMRFLLTRAHDWIFREPGALVTPKDPLEYAAKLRFHQTITDAASYGA